VLSSRIMTGNKSVVRVVVYALILCSLLIGCSGKKDSCEDDGTGNETISDITTNSTGTTGTTSAIIDEEETQSGTKPLDNTTPDDRFAANGSIDDSQDSRDSVSGKEPFESPPNSVDATTPGNTDNDVPSTEPSSVPPESTAATTPEDEDDNMPSYGIELPDDNWD